MKSMHRFLFAGLVLTLMLLLPQNVALGATKTETIDAHFNLMSIKVNGKLVRSNTILYNGTTYVPIRNMAEMVGDLPLTYYPNEKIINLGFIPAGMEEPGVGSDYAASTANDVLEKQERKRVSVGLNSVTIFVNMEKVQANNIVYKGRTYIPLRAVADLLELDLYYHQPTSTAYIGSIPDGELTKASSSAQNPANAGSKSGMTSAPATGSMQGWNLLKGHPYEGSVDIYFSQNGTMLNVSIKDIREIDLNKKITWINDKGQKQTNTVGQIYQVFSDFSGEYTSDWFLEKFGELYTDWLLTSTINAQQIVEQYLKETGQLNTPSNNVTLTPNLKVDTSKPKGLVKENGVSLFYAFDKYGKDRGVYSDNDDSDFVIARISNLPEPPPRISEGWIGVDLLKKIYSADAKYYDQDFVLETPQYEIKYEEYMRITLPKNYKLRNVTEFTADNIRIKKFNTAQANESFDTWIDAKFLEEKTGVYYVYTTENNDFAFRLRSDNGSITLFVVPLPQKWAHVRNQPETVIGGLRMKRENNVDYFYVEDLRKLNVISTSEESTNFKLYFNISDLQKAGILQ